MRKKQKRRRFPEGLKLLNPRNLQKEVHAYGYHFSMKTHAAFMLCLLLAIVAIGMIFQLRLALLLVVAAAAFLALPSLIRDMYQRMYEQRRFSDVSSYMEQMLYSFQKSGKVLSSLKECLDVFEPGAMREAIEAAIRYLEAGEARTEDGLLREALSHIEKPYACGKLHTVHELLISSEMYGGDNQESILIMLNDLEVWRRRGYKLQAEKKIHYRDNIISAGIATAFCAVALYVLDYIKNLSITQEPFDIFSVGIIQASSLLFLLFMLWVLVRGSKRLTSDWLKDERLYEDDYILKSYRMVMDYDEGRERKKSLIMAFPFLAAGVAAAVLWRVWIGALLLVIGILVFASYRIGRGIAKKEVEDELYVDLPQWLVEMALLLQNNNVQVAMHKSMANAPAVLRVELEKMMERLAAEPGRLSSYTDFCKSFDVPEIQTCMKMLHSISESGTGDAGTQIANLLQRVGEMQAISDGVRDRKNLYQTKKMFYYPVVGASAKLIVDLFIGMMYLMQMIGSAGGM